MSLHLSTFHSMADDVDRLMHELAERQHGVVAGWQLRSEGMPSGAWRRRVRSGGWALESPVVARRLGAPRSREQQVAVQLLDLGRGAVLSHRTAAAWWGLPGFPLVPVHAATEVNARRRKGRAAVHVVRSLPERWVTTLRGLRVARPELTVLHLAATEHPERAERALDNAWKAKLLTGRSVRELLDEMGRSGRNGVALLRRFSAERADDYVPHDSGLEARAARVLSGAGLGRFVPQVDLGGDRWTGRVDLRHVRLPVVVEVQSALHHSALCDKRADAERIARLRSDGFTVVEITDEEVWQRPDVVVDRVRSAIAQRSVA